MSCSDLLSHQCCSSKSSVTHGWIQCPVPLLIFLHLSVALTSVIQRPPLCSLPNVAAKKPFPLRLPLTCWLLLLRLCCWYLSHLFLHARSPTPTDTQQPSFCSSLTDVPYRHLDVLSLHAHAAYHLLQVSAQTSSSQWSLLWPSQGKYISHCPQESLISLTLFYFLKNSALTF